MTRRYRDLYASQLEDSLLAVGGLVAAFPATVGDAQFTIVAAVMLAAVGKATPSLIGQMFASHSGPFPRDSKGGVARPGPTQRDWWDVSGDSILLAGALVALLVLGLGIGFAAFLFFIGLGFSAKAFISLLELWVLAGVYDDPMTPDSSHDDGQPSRSTRLGSNTTENVLLLALGASAIFFAFSGEPGTAQAAVGLAALGKALPSFIATALGSSSA